MASVASGIARGEIVGGRYRVESVLGAGGMSTIYEATDLPSGAIVALKVLDEEPEGIALERFRREVQAAARLAHPNVVRVLDSQVGRPTYLVMERLRGRALGEEVQFLGRMSPARAARIVYQLLSALDAAHGAGVVHRDVKPSNVLVTSTDTEGDIVKVLDFGIAKLEEGPEGAPRTRTGEVVGTIAYMSPEQAMGLAVDARTDIYGAGAVLYYLLSGRRPVEARTVAEVVRRLMHGQTQSLAEVGVSVSPALEAVLSRALRRAPDARFQTAREMADALAAAEPAARIPAPPPPPVTSVPTITAARPASLDDILRNTPGAEILLSPPRTPQAFPPPSSGALPSSGPVSSGPISSSRDPATRAREREARRARREARARRERFAAISIFVATVVVGLLLALVGTALLARKGADPAPRATPTR